MPKACPYKLMDAISVYRNQMQRTFGLILILFFFVDSQQIIRKKSVATPHGSQPIESSNY